MIRAAVTLVAAIFAAPIAYAQNFSSDDLVRRAIDRRAVEAAIWGIPAVNFDLMYQEMSRRPAAIQPDPLLVAASSTGRTRRSRPIPDVIYLMPFFNTKDVGPWCSRSRPPTTADQRQHHELLAGRDRGRRPGRRRQGQGRQIPDPAAWLRQEQAARRLHRLAVGHYQGYALLRSVLKSGSEADIAKAVAYGKRIKLYPLSQAANPPPTDIRRCGRRSCSIPRFPTTCASSSRSIAWCRPSRGWSGTRR